MEEQGQIQGTQVQETQPQQEQISVAPQQTPVETQEQPPKDSITLDEAGELQIPDSFWGLKEDKAPQHYTPEELATAVHQGNVEEARLKPELMEYYKAIQQQQQQQQQQQPQQQPQQQIQPQQPQLQAQQQQLQHIQQQQQLQQLQQQQLQQRQSASSAPPITWDQVMEAGKLLASRNYLGINPNEFDPYDPKHTAAQTMAVNEIRDRAVALRQQHVQRQQVGQQVQNLYAAYKAQVPEMDEISERFFPLWKENLTKREYDAVNAIVSSGDIRKIQLLFNRVVGDYRKTVGKASMAPQPVKNPPSVMNAAGGDNTEQKGMVNVSKLGEMSPEEQATWLISNKFV